MNKNNLIKKINNSILSPYKEKIIELIKPSISLNSVKTNEEDIQIGQSKLGGLPHLPKDWEWFISAYTGKPLSFLAQLNFAELKHFDEENLLPNYGWLYFFGDMGSDETQVKFYDGDKNELEKKQLTEIFKADDRSFWQKLFGKEKRNSNFFEGCILKAKLSYSIPDWSSFYIEKIRFSTKTDIATIDAINLETYEDESDSIGQHQILGYPLSIQNSFIETEALQIKIDYKNLKESDFDTLLKYKLLCQLDSDNNAKMNFIDAGRYYFFIHEDDLKAKNFNNIKSTIQFY
jgi:uncharacterized protein YwqG